MFYFCFYLQLLVLFPLRSWCLINWQGWACREHGLFCADINSLCVLHTLFQSSLLSAVLGELPPSSGLVNVHGRIAYVSQQPWVFSGTVRSNILFGKKYEKERYEKVIKACALKKVTFESLMLCFLVMRLFL